MNFKSLTYFFFILALSCLALSVKAQTPKVEALRAEYINKALKLSESESKSFWPIYNEFHDKLKAIKKNYRQTMNNLPEDFTDKKAEEIINLEIQTRQAEVDLEKQYNEKFKSILGIKKLGKLKQAEFNFKQKVLETVKQQGG
jgi:predicted component of viral defense system (DUF524 family)